MYQNTSHVKDYIIQRDHDKGVSALNRNLVNGYLAFVEPYYSDKDPAHDFHHIRRMIRRLPTLCDDVMPEPRRDVLYFLSCFHGLVSLLRTDSEFYEKARHFLRELTWTEDEMNDAFLRLERHLENPLSVEEQVVHDANYVELLGAFGIAKAFTKGGSEGQSFEKTADIFEHQYLDKIEFRTPTGKRLAKEGRQYVKGFLGRLRNELSCMGDENS